MLKGVNYMKSICFRIFNNVDFVDPVNILFQEIALECCIYVILYLTYSGRVYVQ